jgi:hypothetical protein
MILVDKDSAPARDFGPYGVAPTSWYVTNGVAVVGPVDTELLLRGIASARISNDCMVKQPSWDSWRALHQIRELARLGRPFSWTEDDRELCPGIPETFVRHARDAGEALLFAMHAAVKATRATAGLVHRMREPFVGLVTSSALGSGVDDQLGQVVPRLDPAFELARRGELLVGALGSASSLGPERAIARRFSACAGELEGVAMVPVFDGGKLLAMIELARADHPFRGADAAVLSKIAQVVCVR